MKCLLWNLSLELEMIGRRNHLVPLLLWVWSRRDVVTHLFPSWQLGQCGGSWWDGWMTGSGEDSGLTSRPSPYAPGLEDRQAHPCSSRSSPSHMKSQTPSL